MNIVSLLPSATEIIDALGMTAYLVGRSHECDWPAGVAQLPVLTAPKMNPRADAATIDGDVRTLVENGASVYRLDADRLRALAPDFVITQSQCELCAVSLEEVSDAFAQWVGPIAEPRLVSLTPMTLADVAADILRLGRALGADTQGKSAAARFEAGFTDLRAQLADQPQPKVFFMEWPAPIMGAGYWMPEIIAAAGGQAILGRQGDHAPIIDLAALAAADPDVIIVGPCGFSIDRAQAEMATLAGQPEFQTLRAGNVFIVDGNHYFNRPGPRLLDSAHITEEILHPDCVPAQHHGTGWVRHV